MADEETQCDLNHQHFAVDSGLVHNGTSPWEDYKGKDRKKHIAQMIGLGNLPKELLYEPFNPCGCLREWIVEFSSKTPKIEVTQPDGKKKKQ